MCLGLKLEDLYVEHPDVVKALSRLPPDVLRARELRIKRAFDLSLKKKAIYSHQQVGDPLEVSNWWLIIHLNDDKC